MKQDPHKIEKWYRTHTQDNQNTQTQETEQIWKQMKLNIQKGLQECYPNKKQKKTTNNTLTPGKTNLTQWAEEKENKKWNTYNKKANRCKKE